MKKLLTVIGLLSFTVVIAQGTSSNLRVSREVEKTMSITSDIIDGVMTYEKEKKITPVIEEQFNIGENQTVRFLVLMNQKNSNLCRWLEKALVKLLN